METLVDLTPDQLVKLFSAATGLIAAIAALVAAFRGKKARDAAIESSVRADHAAVQATDAAHAAHAASARSDQVGRDVAEVKREQTNSLDTAQLQAIVRGTVREELRVLLGKQPAEEQAPPEDEDDPGEPAAGSGSPAPARRRARPQWTTANPTVARQP